MRVCSHCGSRYEETQVGSYLDLLCPNCINYLDFVKSIVDDLGSIMERACNLSDSHGITVDHGIPGSYSYYANILHDLQSKNNKATDGQKESICPVCKAVYRSNVGGMCPVCYKEYQELYVELDTVSAKRKSFGYFDEDRKEIERISTALKRYNEPMMQYVEEYENSKKQILVCMSCKDHYQDGGPNLCIKCLSYLRGSTRA